MPKYDVTAVQILRQTIIFEVEAENEQIAQGLVNNIADNNPLDVDDRAKVSVLDTEDEVVLDTLVSSVELAPEG
jgi:hypothetical protein